MEMSKAFKYLRQVLTSSDDECLSVVENICKSRSRWAWFSRILGQEREDPRTFGTFYKAVVKVTLFFGLETWVMTPRIRRTIGIFHH